MVKTKGEKVRAEAQGEMRRRKAKVKSEGEDWSVGVGKHKGDKKLWGSIGDMPTGT